MQRLLATWWTAKIARARKLAALQSRSRERHAKRCTKKNRPRKRSRNQLKEFEWISEAPPRRRPLSATRELPRRRPGAHPRRSLRTYRNPRATPRTIVAGLRSGRGIDQFLSIWPTGWRGKLRCSATSGCADIYPNRRRQSRRNVHFRRIVAAIASPVSLRAPTLAVTASPASPRRVVTSERRGKALPYHFAQRCGSQHLDLRTVTEDVHHQFSVVAVRYLPVRRTHRIRSDRAGADATLRSRPSAHAPV